MCIIHKFIKNSYAYTIAYIIKEHKTVGNDNVLHINIVS